MDEYRIAGVVAINGKPQIWTSNVRVLAQSPEEAQAAGLTQSVRREDRERASWHQVNECTNLSEMRRGYDMRRFDPCI